MKKSFLFQTLKMIVCFFFFATAGAGCSKESQNPMEPLGKFLETPAAERGDLASQPFAETALTSAQAAAASKQLWADYAARLREHHQDEWDGKKITLGEDVMRFEKRLFGDAPEDGRSLYISMHGGGGAPARINDQQWQNQTRLYETPAGSLYVAPRAPTNDWDLWHKSHIDTFFDRIILNSILFENVNPNKVYIMGYSAGGDGVYQLAPRMADRWAAAAIMAGHPNDASPLGLRNVPFSIWVGKHDAAYKRNEVTVKWGKKMDDLQKQDPDGYIHKLNVINSGHWMNRLDAAAIPWMAQYTRNPAPSRVVWKQDDVRHDRFYWLAIPTKKAPGKTVAASVAGQVVTVENNEGFGTLLIRLNDNIVDLDKPVTVKYGDTILFNGKASRTIAMINKALHRRQDPASVFCAEIAVSLEPEKPSEK
ncbi:MAG: alpha/beta hydrolase [Planctomycetota bacterium]